MLVNRSTNYTSDLKTEIPNLINQIFRQNLKAFKMLLLCTKKDAGSRFSRAKIEAKEDSTLGSIRSEAAKMSGLDEGAFNLLHCGRLLRTTEDSKTLSACNVRPTSTLHIIPKAPQQQVDPAAKRTLSEDEMQQFLIAFGMAVRNPAFHRVAQRLGKRESLENLTATCPELAKDPIALAFLSKPELLFSLLEPETLKYVSDKHPGLGEAAYQLAAAVHEERATPSTSASGASTEAELPPPFAYNLDDISDDEEDEDEEMEMAAAMASGGASRGGNRGSRGGSLSSAITADQLAAALAAAQSSIDGGGMGGMTGMTSHRNQPQSQPIPQQQQQQQQFQQQPRPSTSTGMITQGQLAAALAMAVGSLQAPSQQQPQQQQQQQREESMEQKLATMREMGITDMGLATKALEVMSGDLQAAINLILSGWLGLDDAPN